MATTTMTMSIHMIGNHRDFKVNPKVGEERDGARDSSLNGTLMALYSKRDENVGQCLSLSINAKTSQLINIFEESRRGGGRKSKETEGVEGIEGGGVEEME